jgi:hypothetical protein
MEKYLKYKRKYLIAKNTGGATPLTLKIDDEVQINSSKLEELLQKITYNPQKAEWKKMIKMINMNMISSYTITGIIRAIIPRGLPHLPTMYDVMITKIKEGNDNIIYEKPYFGYPGTETLFLHNLTPEHFITSTSQKTKG